MEPLQINVSVNVSVDSALHALLAAFVNRPAAVAATETAAAKPAAVQETPKPAVAADPQPASAAQPEQQPEKEYTEVDVRAAMDRARRRIEGENYKDQTDSEGYKKYHRKLTAWFKETAKYYGSDKPSTLPDSESRRKFIMCCDAVAVKDGEVIDDLPF